MGIKGGVVVLQDEINKEKVKMKLPVLLIHDQVLIPSSELRLEYASDVEKKILSLTEMYYDNHLLVVFDNDSLEINPDINDLSRLGVLAMIKMKMDMPNGKTRVVLEGIKRSQILTYLEEEDYLEAEVTPFPFVEMEKKEELAYIKTLVKQIEDYVELESTMSNAVLGQLVGVTSLSTVTDIVASHILTNFQKQKEYIEILDTKLRVSYLIDYVQQELQIIELEQKIEQEVAFQMDKSQKEYFLREKVRIIKEELGDFNQQDELDLLKEQVSKLKCGSKVRERLRLELKRYENCSPNSPELGMIRNYIDWLLSLPWSIYTKDTTDLGKVKKSLDDTHYGLDDVKERILEYLAVKQNTNHSRSPILCLVGPPGVGKTSLAKSIAKSLGRHVAKISLGGINDEAEIIGHRRTYLGSSPGRIIQGIRKAATANPLFIIDEIDKMTKDIKGDPASSLLEILDPEQNAHFSDHYIEEEFDLSKVMFIATANYIDQIPRELTDRLEVIEISSYTEYEKLDIAVSYIIPKELEEHGLTPIQVQIDNAAILSLIRHYTNEAGVRSLERVFARMFRKIVKSFLVDKTRASYHITKKELSNLLGPERYSYQDSRKTEGEVGVTNGMAYTLSGGDILSIEATYYSGNGQLLLTGSMGEVMKESAKIALSYIKSHEKDFDLDHQLLFHHDIHIHVPDGSIPKDGPSAGIAMTTALISLLKNKKIKANLSMTGEITLRGKILPVGGIKEKVIAAHRSGIKTIILPKKNEKDLVLILEDVKNDLTFCFVEYYEEVYQQLFKMEEKGKESNDGRK